MASGKTLRRAISLAHIVRDMQFVRRLIEDSLDESSRKIPAMYAYMPFVAIMVYEAAAYLKKLGTKYHSLYDLIDSPQLAGSRHSSKLFDGYADGFDGVNAFFEAGVLSADRQYFIDSIRFRSLRFLGTDLGITAYGNVPVYTTHSVQFTLGIDPRLVKRDNMSAALFDLSRQCAQFADLVSMNTEWSGPSFIRGLNLDGFSFDDVVAAAYYERAFDECLPDGATASLTVMQTTLNTLNTLISLDTCEKSRATVCKLHFIMARHVSAALSQIRERFADQLSDTSMELLHQALAEDPAAEILQRSSNMARNALIHYGLTKDFPDSELDVDRPLFGIVESAHPNLGYANFSRMTLEQSRRLSEILNKWSVEPAK
jgi:hypothetical protein